jgi:endothelin-converting enzyme/putative endopeptidase
MFLAGLPASGKSLAGELFHLLRERFARTVAGATWLDEPTREAAAAKVRRTALRFDSDPVPGLGDVVLPAGSLLDAELRTSAQMSERYLGLIGSVAKRELRIDRDEGAMYSSLVNGIWLSPEFARFPWVQRRPFSPVNFGSLGTLMGHEIAHALTITGRRYDDAGVKRETWPPPALSAFDSHTACLERELRAFDVGAKWKVDAHKTLDEDMAELVGLQIALTTMEADAGATSVPDRDDRRRQFFIAYAQQECGFYRERDAEDMVDEVHSPLARRLGGILANVPEFAETFHCPAGSRMAPADRCAIW